ncbi:MAG: hypothetical protein AAF529_12845 [Pseudomonadota bacterium]
MSENSPYTVVARNFSAANENRIHSDEIARKFGFRGALVPGVAIWRNGNYLYLVRIGFANRS